MCPRSADPASHLLLEPLLQCLSTLGASSDFLDGFSAWTWTVPVEGHVSLVKSCLEVLSFHHIQALCSMLLYQ